MNAKQGQKATRIDYSTWRTSHGAELRSGSGTDRVEIAKICPKLVDGEAHISGEAAIELAAALVEAAALAGGGALVAPNGVIADLGTLIKIRQQAGRKVEAADPDAIASLAKAIKDTAELANKTETAEQLPAGDGAKPVYEAQVPGA